LRCIIQMIKRISHIVIAAMLLLVSSGLTIHQHYCHGSLVETSIFHELDFCCGEGADCCNNESETFQLKEDYISFFQLIGFNNVVIELPVMEYSFTGCLEVQFKPLSNYEILYPPDLGTVLARLQVFCL